MSKLPPFKLKLLGGDWLDVQKKPRHQKAFDVLVVGTQLAYVMGSERLNGLLKPSAHIMLETAKFLVEVRKQQRQEYIEKLVKVASRIGWSVRAPAGGASGAAAKGTPLAVDRRSVRGVTRLEALAGLLRSMASEEAARLAWVRHHLQKGEVDAARELGWRPDGGEEGAAPPTPPSRLAVSVD